MRLVDKLDKRYAKICIYAGATVLIVFVLGIIIWYSGGFLSTIANLLGAVLAPLIFGAIISYLLHPLVERVNYALSGGKPHTERGKALWAPSVFLTLILVGLVVVGIIVLMAMVITRSISGLSLDSIVQTAQGLWVKLQTDFADIFNLLKGAVGNFGDLFSSANIGVTATQLISNVSGFVASAGFSIIFAMWFMIDGPRLSAYGKRVALNLFGPQVVAAGRDLLADADKVFSSYIRGQFVDALILGTLTALLMSIFQVPYGSIIGILTGVGNLIPGFGAPVGAVMLALVCLTQGNIPSLIVGAIVLFITTTVDANFINPRLMSKSISIHPIVMLMALIAGGAVGGIAGMLVAVPTGAFIKLRFDRWMDEREAAARKQKR